jgi:hypothetical protein
MARQTELLDMLVQAQQQQFRPPQRGREEHPSAGYQDFFSTQPPLFHKTEEPLDADAWLRSIESKFALLSAPCSEANKTLFAAQQLRGTAHIWWDNYYAMQPDGHVVTWPPLGCTISRKDSLSESSMNFWHLPKKTVLYFNTHRLLITCANTRVIMLIRTPRKEIDSVAD